MTGNGDNAKQPERQLPFDNLYLNNGYVTGSNNPVFYILTIVLTMLAYFMAPVLTFAHLFLMATAGGMTPSEIAADPYALLDENRSGINRNYILMGTLAIYAVTAIVFTACIRRIHGKTLTSVLTGFEKFRTRRFWFAFVVWSILIILTFLAELVSGTGEYEFITATVKGGFSGTLLLNMLGTLVLLVVFLPVQTAFEEVFFRGYLVQGSAQAIGNGIVPLLLSSLLFGSAHMMNPEVTQYGVPLMLAYYSAFGLFMGAISLLDEGLELAWGIHLANNLVSSLLVTSDHSVIRTFALFHEKSASVYLEMLTWLVSAVIAFFVFWKKYKWHNFGLLIR